MNRSAGTRIDAYEIEGVLGAGGFGVTYRVRDRKLGLRFALKEYFPEHAAERSESGEVEPRPGQAAAFHGGMERFLDEGRTLAGLDHPNLATVVRHFEANGTAWLLMPLYDGRTLHELLVSGGLFDPGETAALLEPLLDALAYLERQGVVHGDIKPANILVQRDGDPVLLDFGAARLARGDEPVANASAGSAGYAATEQTRGIWNVGPWTDLYGLAATLYRLTSGIIPVPSEDRLAALERGEPDPLAPLRKQHRAGGQAGFSRAFTSAVDQALAVRPDDRPQNVAHWRRLLGGSPGDVGRRSRRRKPHRGLAADPERRVWLPQVLAGAFLVILILVGGWLWFASPERESAGGEATESSLPDTSLAEDQDAWEQAVRTDSAAAFREYLKAFPRGRHAPAAREQLALFDEAAWAEAEADGSLSAYERYLERFPDGRFVIEATGRAEVARAAEAAAATAAAKAAERDRLAFEAARRLGSDAALDEYLARFPGGDHVDEALALKAGNALARRDDAAWRAAVQRDERDGYAAYLRAFPEGKYLAEALAAVERLTLRPGKVFRDCDACPEMIVIPPGSFEQGSPPDGVLARSNEQPRHSVRISRPFAMSVYEVTFDEWDACVAERACRAQPVDNGWGRGRRPVFLVRWVDGVDYVEWLSGKTGQIYELPSESEWEYVARAGEDSAWTGGAPERVCDHGNVAGAETSFEWRHAECADPFSVGTAEVGYFAPNKLGVYDLVGNVAEWTRDCMNLSYLDAPTDGSAWERGLCSSRITRGGSWFSGSVEIRLPARFALRTGESNDFTGLRVVRVVRE
jgi:formylglycine-generating enzyme required for sulfatase activity/serine/threonine protein kinase